MKKHLLLGFAIISILLNFPQTSFCATQTELLNKIENALFGFEYNNEDDKTRITRIEKEVYGASSNANIAERLSKLNKDLGAELYGQEIPPCEDTLAKEEEEREVLPSQTANIDYPVINELEKSVFNKEYKNIGVKDRLAQLEKKVFSKDFSSDDLSTRVDRLREQIRPASLEPTIANGYDDYNISGYYPPPIDYDGMTIGGNSYSYTGDYYNSQSSYPMPSKKINLTTVENALYNQNFKSDTMQNRLSRVEKSMFGETFTDQDEQTRIGRISSAYNAQKSASKYDSNKFTQNMSTAMQIGTMILMLLACIL